MRQSSVVSLQGATFSVRLFQCAPIPRLKVGKSGITLGFAIEGLILRLGSPSRRRCGRFLLDGRIAPAVLVHRPCRHPG